MSSTDVWLERAPARALAGAVDGYVGYRSSIGNPALHRGLPSRHLTLIVSIGPTIDVLSQTDDAQPGARYRCVLGGLQASSALIAHGGHEEGVAIDLSPLGCRALLGMPAAELWDRSFEASEVFGSAGDELWERVQGASTWPERFAACDTVLVGRLRGARTSDELTGCWSSITGSHGTLGVQELADRAGYSRQHLGRLFRAEFGLSPKLASRVVRFDRAVTMMRSAGPPFSLGDLAAACGFADQAHLHREMVDLAGCTPGELLAGDVPFVQDSVAVDG